MPTAKRLIVEQPKDSLTTYGVNRLPKLAFDIESAVIKAGGKPGTDYTFKDIMEWAVAVYTAREQGESIDELKSRLSDETESMWSLFDHKLDSIHNAIASIRSAMP